MQAALGSSLPVDETRWIQEIGDRTGVPDGMVAECHLAQDDDEAVLAEPATYGRVCGIRDFGEGAYLVDPAWQRGYQALERYGWTFCLDSDPDRYADAARLARPCPAWTLSLDHAGFPRRRDLLATHIEHWRTQLGVLAEHQNATVEIGGLGVGDPRWTVESLRPWVLTCIRPSASIDRSGPCTARARPVRDGA